MSWIADSRSLHCRHCRYLHTPHCGLASGKEAWTHCGQYRNTLRSPQLRIANTAGTYTLHNADSTCIVTECGPPPLRTPRLHVADTAGTYTLRNADLFRGEEGTFVLLRTTPVKHCGHCGYLHTSDCGPGAQCGKMLWPHCGSRHSGLRTSALRTAQAPHTPQCGLDVIGGAERCQCC